MKEILKDIGTLLINVLIFLFSVIASLALSIFGALWAVVRSGSLKKLSSYFLNYAIMIDRTGNLSMSYMFNDVLIKKDGYTFGQKDETISGVLGKNYKAHTLRFMGEELSEGLDTIQKDHVTISIDNTPKDI